MFAGSDNWFKGIKPWTAHAHVLPSLLRKFHEAKTQNHSEVEIWGTGNPRREFLYVDDLADVCLFLMEHYPDSEIINVGVGEDISIRDLSMLLKEIVGYSGKVIWNTAMPDGTPRKLLDVTRINSLGWRSATSLEDGIRKTYQWFLKKIADDGAVAK